MIIYSFGYDSCYDIETKYIINIKKYTSETYYLTREYKMMLYTLQTEYNSSTVLANQKPDYILSFNLLQTQVL